MAPHYRHCLPALRGKGHPKSVLNQVGISSDFAIYTFSLCHRLLFDDVAQQGALWRNWKMLQVFTVRIVRLNCQGAYCFQRSAYLPYLYR